MPTFKYLPFSSDTFPIRNEYEIDGKDFEFEFNYNSVGDFISVLVRNSEGETLFTSKLIYGVPLNRSVVEGFPNHIQLIPLDLEDLYRDEFIEVPINKTTFGSTVQIYIVEEI
ncbi:phage baseplate plug family protein [Leptospira stimsonii]|uniref:Cyanophage baseplate Pam3 plug gp18 domain-containing protein n=1 Tax=Leptospira stimsonii TaxID=2202203 RepID=A0A396Z522_9LEPT|nr:hypothetical protein [Leptospira stimsonii]RHX89845.1 hypothetical protein DLM75_12885 [Leptospira stimsonii]